MTIIFFSFFLAVFNYIIFSICVVDVLQCQRKISTLWKQTGQ